MNAPHILTIRFKDLRPQEIRFQRRPEFKVVNNKPGLPGCTVWVNDKRYCTFIVECEGWG